MWPNPNTKQPLPGQAPGPAVQPQPLARDPMAAASQYTRANAVPAAPAAPVPPAAPALPAQTMSNATAPSQQLGGLAQPPSAAALENLRRMQAAQAAANAPRVAGV